MSDHDDATAPAADDGDLAVHERRVERTFTCSICGYPTTREAGLLRTAVRGTCVDCGDWTLQFADRAAAIEGAKTAAGALSDDLLTERQALAYLLRNVLGVDRGPAAEAMDASASNLDNLERRARRKVEGARRTLAALDGLRAHADSESADDTPPEVGEDDRTDE